jgi:hypothetical protein
MLVDLASRDSEVTRYPAAVDTEPGWTLGVWGLVTVLAGAVVIFLSMVSRGDDGGLLFGCLLVLSGLLIRIEAAVHGIARRTGKAEDR